jgi:hypothetical protein
MKKMSRDASVHEKTVQAVARGAVNPPKRHAPPRQRRIIATYTVTVDRRVWEKARELAGGDMTRITIISATEVIVR